MVYETKFTRLTPAADFSMESLEQQFQLKMELEQVEQYLKENYTVTRHPLVDFNRL